MDVQVQIANGNVVFTVVGLGDKAVAELRERVRAALNASGLAMPAKRITVNLAPAFPKEGSLHGANQIQGSHALSAGSWRGTAWFFRFEPTL